MASAKVMEKLLAPYASIDATLSRADEPWPDGPAQIDQADGVVMFVTEGARWLQNDPRRYAAISQMLKRGGGLVAIHWSVGAKEGQYMEQQLQILGGSRGGPERKYTYLETDVTVLNPEHPIVTGVESYRVHDEFYYNLDLLQAGPTAPAGGRVITPLLSAKIEDKDEICGWAFEPEVGGRSFGFVCLHYHRNWELPHYRRLVVQGVLWTLDLPIPAGGVDPAIDPAQLELAALIAPSPVAP
jgi:type 1 glutamine amidotransferase